MIDSLHSKPEDINVAASSYSSSDFLLFKFRPINKYLIESLINSQLYFAAPSQLNDPFDCQLDLRKAISRAESLTQGQRNRILKYLPQKMGDFIEQWQGQFKNHGVCSFTKYLIDPEVSPLMWTHYADQHRGVCLLYRFELAFLAEEKNCFGISDVEYDDDRLTSWLCNEAPLGKEDFKKLVEGMTKIYLTSKSSAWSYERERRWIRDRHGLFDIPRGSLFQVSFGLNTPKTDIDLVTELADKYCGCNKFFRIVRGKNDFGLEHEPL